TRATILQPIRDVDPGIVADCDPGTIGIAGRHVDRPSGCERGHCRAGWGDGECASGRRVIYGGHKSVRHQERSLRHAAGARKDTSVPEIGAAITRYREKVE